jgi:hypothetical protein
MIWRSGSCGDEINRKPSPTLVILKVFGGGLDAAMHGVSGEAEKGSLHKQPFVGSARDISIPEVHASELRPRKNIPVHQNKPDT